jgi:SulP family sulfate permease
VEVRTVAVTPSSYIHFGRTPGPTSGGHMAIVHKSTATNRYKAEPSVLTALRTPRLLTREVLAGLVVATAIIPEAIAFSIIAGVDPRVGLFSSFVMAVAISFVGGRPAMITAATVILAGVLQIGLSLLGVAKLMRFIPRSVMIGFVNALAILIFAAQLPQLLDVPFMVYPLVAARLLIMIVMPRITKVIPAPLVAIVIHTVVTIMTAINVPTIGD